MQLSEIFKIAEEEEINNKSENKSWKSVSNSITQTARMNISEINRQAIEKLKKKAIVNSQK